MKIVLNKEEVKKILEKHIMIEFGVIMECETNNFYSDIEFKEVVKSSDAEEHS